MFYDSHTHTVNSDGKNTVKEMYEAAIEKGALGITVTDHANMIFFADDPLERIKKSIADVKEVNESAGKGTKILCGVEMGEYLCDPVSANKIIALNELDSVLCSVHYLPDSKWNVPYNRVNFSTEGTDEENDQYIGQYFDLLLKTSAAFDFNVLAHIICPARYMTHKYGRTTDVMKYKEKICLILEQTIKKHAALELNSSGLKTEPYANQYKSVLKLYKDLGGKLITIGSDAHSKLSIISNFDLAQNMLEACGFSDCCYYEKKEPITIKF